MVISITSCNGLSKDTNPLKISFVEPAVEEAVKLTQPNADWFVGPNRVL